MSRTIRSIVGATRAGAIDPRRTALVLIDFQNEYFDGALPLPDGGAAVRQAAALVRHADAHGIAVVHVRHVNGEAAPLFARGSAQADIHAELAPAPHHHVVDKSSVSAFATTDLAAWLRERGIGTLVVAGLMTHMCVSTFAREARGWQVVVAADACATRDIDSWSGDGVVPHAVLHEAALTALADNFADVRATAAILNLPIEEK